MPISAAQPLQALCEVPLRTEHDEVPAACRAHLRSMPLVGPEDEPGYETMHSAVLTSPMWARGGDKSYSCQILGFLT